MLKEKMTVRELLDSGLFTDKTEYEIMTCNDPVEFWPEDPFMYAAFADFVVDNIAASADGKIQIYFSMQPEIRRAQA